MVVPLPPPSSFSALSSSVQPVQLKCLFNNLMPVASGTQHLHSKHSLLSGVSSFKPAVITNTALVKTCVSSPLNITTIAVPIQSTPFFHPERVGIVDHAVSSSVIAHANPSTVSHQAHSNSNGATCNIGVPRYVTPVVTHILPSVLNTRPTSQNSPTRASVATAVQPKSIALHPITKPQITQPLHVLTATSQPVRPQIRVLQRAPVLEPRFSITMSATPPVSRSNVTAKSVSVAIPFAAPSGLKNVAVAMASVSSVESPSAVPNSISPLSSTVKILSSQSFNKISSAPVQQFGLPLATKVSTGVSVVPLPILLSEVTGSSVSSGETGNAISGGSGVKPLHSFSVVVSESTSLSVNFGDGNFDHTLLPDSWSKRVDANSTVSSPIKIAPRGSASGRTVTFFSERPVIPLSNVDLLPSSNVSLVTTLSTPPTPHVDVSLPNHAPIVVNTLVQDDVVPIPAITTSVVSTDKRLQELRMAALAKVIPRRTAIVPVSNVPFPPSVELSVPDLNSPSTSSLFIPFTLPVLSDSKLFSFSTSGSSSPPQIKVSEFASSVVALPSCLDCSSSLFAPLTSSADYTDSDPKKILACQTGQMATTLDCGRVSSTKVHLFSSDESVDVDHATTPLNQIALSDVPCDLDDVTFRGEVFDDSLDSVSDNDDINPSDTFVDEGSSDFNELSSDDDLDEMGSDEDLENVSAEPELELLSDDIEQADIAVQETDVDAVVIPDRESEVTVSAEIAHLRSINGNQERECAFGLESTAGTSKIKWTFGDSRRVIPVAKTAVRKSPEHPNDTAALVKRVRLEEQRVR